MGDQRQVYLGETSGYRGIPVFNAEQDRTISLKKPFMKLMALASAVNQEEQRYVCEKFESNKEVSLYDMLFRDEIIKEDMGISNPLEFWKLFEKCISIDDVQVLEDIFAVSFGIALDQFICDQYLLIASIWFVENLFSKEKIERWMQNTDIPQFEHTDIPQFDKWISNTNERFFSIQQLMYKTI
ncbi:MAG: hypothetical protein V8R61_10200 [Enterocloster sp.]